MHICIQLFHFSLKITGGLILTIPFAFEHKPFLTTLGVL